MGLPSLLKLGRMSQILGSFMTSAGTYRNGLRIGIKMTTMGKVPRGIQKGLLRASIGYSEVAPGGLVCRESALQAGTGIPHLHGGNLLGSVVPRTFRNNFYTCALFPFLQS